MSNENFYNVFTMPTEEFNWYANVEDFAEFINARQREQKIKIFRDFNELKSLKIAGVPDIINRVILLEYLSDKYNIDLFFSELLEPYEKIVLSAERYELRKNESNYKILKSKFKDLIKTKSLTSLDALAEFILNLSAHEKVFVFVIGAVYISKKENMPIENIIESFYSKYENVLILEKSLMKKYFYAYYELAIKCYDIQQIIQIIDRS